MPRTSRIVERNQDLVESSISAVALIDQDIELIVLLINQLESRGAPRVLVDNLRRTIGRIHPRLQRTHNNLAAIHQLADAEGWYDQPRRTND